MLADEAAQRADETSRRAAREKLAAEKSIAESTAALARAIDDKELAEKTAQEAKLELEKATADKAAAEKAVVDARSALQVAEGQKQKADEAVREARELLTSAEQERERAAQIAEAARAKIRRLEDELKTAQAGRDSAVRLESLARERYEREQRRLFNNQLRRAQRIYRQSPDEALFLLDDTNCCPLHLRDFTWRYLRRASNRLDLQLGPHQADLRAIADSPDGVTLASVADSIIYCWNTSDGSLRVKLECPDHLVAHIRWAPNGKMLLSWEGDKTLRFPPW